mmetsp:Transcript_29166/g.41594  ORF Transcript_29166/g.41594 Transcript_29166/m.41594 type:complete len:247 (+) Transcript_29166:30-770(+)
MMEKQTKYEYPPLSSAIPFSTILISALILAVKREDFISMLEVYALLWNISQWQLTLFAIAGLIGIMLLAWSLYSLWIYMHHQILLRNELIQIKAKEKQALLKIYETMGGDKWKDNTNWCGDKLDPYNPWKGVKLDPNSGRVRKIILPSSNLTGCIPEEIGDLQALIEIDFRDNNIRGPIPKSMCNLTNLEGLYLYDNFMEGTIPMELSDLPYLSGIYLFNNRFQNSAEASRVFKSKLSDKGCHVFI